MRLLAAQILPLVRMLTKNKMRMHVKVLPEGLESLMEEPRHADEDTV